MKPIRLLLLVLAMFMPMMVNADPVEIGGIYYNLTSTSKTAEVTKHLNEYSGEVIIPETVTYDGEEYSVTSIGGWAFDSCKGVTSVSIPNSVTSIGGWAFNNCSGLTSVHISDFEAWCNISFDTVISNPLYYAHHLYLNGVEIKDLVFPNGMTSIGNYVFAGGSGLTSVTIPNSVTTIGFGAFDGCSSLTSVIIPNSVTSIEDDAFFGCSGLTSVTIPNSVTTIGGFAFYECSSLTSITIPNSLTSTGECAFEGCSSLTSVHISDLEAWCNISFDDNPLSFAHHLYLNGEEIKDLVIPNSITSIGCNAFEGGSGLTSVTIPNSVTSIDWCAFYGCSGLTSVTIPNSVIFIGSSSFSGCSALTSVTIPNSVTSIDRNAFYGCSGLKSITIGTGVTSVGSRSFSECPELTDVYCMAEKVPNTKSDAFNKSNIENATLHVPQGCIDAYKTNLPWNSFKNIVDDVTGTISNDTIKIDNIWYKIDEETGVAKVTHAPSSSNSESSYSGVIIIPETITFGGKQFSVTSIGYNAFRGCSGLTSITIPNGVTSIEDCAFSSCSGLTSVIIPNSVTTIGCDAFYYCSGLTSVTIPNSVTSIRKYAFDGCSSLTSVHISDIGAWCNISFDVNCSNPLYFAHRLYLDGEEIKNLVIPNSVTSIGIYAFVSCSSLTSVTIPNSVTSIGNYAFKGCRCLTSVNIPNSVTSIGGHAFSDCSGLTSVTIPNSVISIGWSAFEGCSELTDFYCMAEKAPSTQSDVFYRANIENITLHVPVGCVDAYKAVVPWKNFKEIVEIEASYVRKVNVATAGTLSTLISDDEKFSITDLIITGYLNGTDFRLIREMAGNDYLGRPTNGVLRKLDISGANIVEGGEKYLDIEQATSSIGKYIQEVGVISYQFVTQNNVLGIAVFAGCDKLEEIALPHSITAIDSYAFLYCLNLNSLEIPKNVSSIGSGFVFGSNKISKISVAEGNQTFSSPEGCEVLMQGTKLIYGLSSAKIPAGTTIIGANAFANCTGLGDVTLPEGVTTIGVRAFAWSGLTSIKMPSTLNTIGNDAFAYCNNLTSVSIDVKKPLVITKTTFTNRANATLYVPAGCKAVYEAADYWKEFKEIIEIEASSVRKVNVATAGTLSTLISDDDKFSITELTITGQLNGDDFGFLRTMAGNDIDGEPTDGMLSKLDISGATIVAGGTYARFGYSCYLDKEHKQMVPTSVSTFEANTLPESLFAGCQKLKEIKLPSSVIKIGRRAFTYTSLTSFTVPKSTTIIEGEVFFSCPISSFEVQLGNGKYYAESNAIVESGSERLVLTCKNTIVPSTVKIIGSNAFTGYQGKTIALPENLEKIEKNAFTSSSIKSLTIPAKVSSIGGFLFGGSNLTELKVDENNATYESPEGSNAIVEKSTKTLVGGSWITVIPSDVKAIGEGAFFSAYSLSAATLPEGIESIGDDAFAYCSLTSIVLPKSIKKLGIRAFNCNLQLATVTSEIIDPSKVTMGYSVFQNISSNAVLKVPFGTSDAYKAAGWDAYFSKIEEMPSSSVRTINVATAGTLSQFFSDAEKSIITDLTITGYLNGTDFRLIREMAGNDYLGRPTNGVLRKLDISGANIVEGGEKYLDIEQVTSLIGKYIQEVGVISYQFVTQNNVLGTAVFAGCDKLEEIALPHSLTAIDGYAFLYCLNLKSLEIPKNVSSIGSGFVFGSNKISKISVAEGNQTFSSPEGSDVLMQGTKLIYGLSSAKIPAGTTIIGANAFANCTGLGDVTLPEGVTTIGVRAFAWSGLTSIKMPSTLNTIGNDAFAYCNNLTSVSIDVKKPLVITKTTFTNRANATLNVPAECKAVYEAADYWKEFKEIVEEVVPKVKLNKTKATIEKGKTLTLKATVTPSDLTDKSVTWKSSKTKVATVSKTGKVTGVNTGSATITCTYTATGAKATCKVTVGNVELDKMEATIEKGKTVTLKATVYPSSADQSVTWESSDTKIATVSTAGKVKGVKAGKATITATSKVTGLKATCSVTVGYVKLAKTEVAVEKGKTLTLSATVYPSSLTDKTVTWKSSNTAVATVTSAGKVKGVKVGTATITCTSKATGLKATCIVNVGYVKLDQAEATILKGNTFTLKATVYPSSLTDKSVTWKSSNTAVATVTSAGKVKGVKAGTVTITAISNATGLKTTCTVTVVNGFVTLNKKEAYVEKGKTLTLKATVTPEALKDKSVTWESSDTKIATVTSAGKVKGVKYGTVTITCTSKSTGAKATCQVTVGKVIISMSSFTLKRTRETILVPTLYPSDLKDKSVTWKSSDTSIATVNADGRVKGIKAGTATITCTSVATGLKGACTVTVLQTVGSLLHDEDSVVVTGINEIEELAVEEPFDVYDLNGHKVKSQVTSLDGLPNGIYIVNGKKILKK